MHELIQVSCNKYRFMCIFNDIGWFSVKKLGADPLFPYTVLITFQTNDFPWNNIKGYILQENN